MKKCKLNYHATLSASSKLFVVYAYNDRVFFVFLTTESGEELFRRDGFFDIFCLDH